MRSPENTRANRTRVNDTTGVEAKIQGVEMASGTVEKFPKLTSETSSCMPVHSAFKTLANV